MLNEVRGGFSHYGFANETLVNWSKHWQAPRVTNGYPRITFTGFTINANANAPRHRDQNVWQLRDDFTMSYEAKGHHDLKLGGEFVRHFEDSENCAMCGGNIDAQQRHRSGGYAPVAVPRSVERRHVESRGAVAVSRARYTIGIGQFPNQYGQPKYAGWAQDDWRMTNKLMLNLGLRYDLSINAWANDLGFEPFYQRGPAERHEQPAAAARLCLSAQRPTVIRGGTGSTSPTR